MIQEKMVVTIDYTVRDDSNEVIDSSEGRQPLVYLHGAQNIVPGLEKALDGMKTGEDFEAIVEPADAYGVYNPDMVQAVPREAFQGVDNIEPGMAFSSQGEQGPFQVVVTEVSDDSVTVDANHPLAGKRLTFNGTVRDVREATAEEISHGHVHSE